MVKRVRAGLGVQVHTRQARVSHQPSEPNHPCVRQVTKDSSTSRTRVMYFCVWQYHQSHPLAPLGVRFSVAGSSRLHRALPHVLLLHYLLAVLGASRQPAKAPKAAQWVVVFAMDTSTDFVPMLVQAVMDAIRRPAARMSAACG
jgi:hypothetical protein